MWSSLSHFVLGIPYDLIQRARRNGGEAEQDLINIVRASVNRLTLIGDQAGVYILGFAVFINTLIAMLGFWYDIEMAQAFFFIMLPLSFVFALSLRAARIIRGIEDVDALYRRLNRQRITTQVIGMISIFITALYGMFHNLAVAPWL